jgi:hypothetical protein
MKRQWNRRELLAQLAGASAGALLPLGTTLASAGLRLTGEDCVVQLTSVSDHPIRLSILPLERGVTTSVGWRCGE